MEKYEKFTAMNGKGTFHRAIDISQISDYDQLVLSPEIVELLESVGLSSYMEGKFWTLDPTEYVDWLNE